MKNYELINLHSGSTSPTIKPNISSLITRSWHMLSVFFFLLLVSCEFHSLTENSSLFVAVFHFFFQHLCDTTLSHAVVTLCYLPQFIFTINYVNRTVREKWTKMIFFVFAKFCFKEVWRALTVFFFHLFSFVSQLMNSNWSWNPQYVGKLYVSLKLWMNHWKWKHTKMPLCRLFFLEFFPSKSDSEIAIFLLLYMWMPRSTVTTGFSGRQKLAKIF